MNLTHLPRPRIKKLLEPLTEKLENMLMSVNNETQTTGAGATIEKTLPQGGLYASLFDKINLDPVASIGELNHFEDNTVMAETSANARVTAAVQVFMQCLQKSG